LQQSNSIRIIANLGHCFGTSAAIICFGREFVKLGACIKLYAVIIVFPMTRPQRYAVVAYVKSPIGEFVESLRRELHPELPHLAAHVTLLPPRLLQGTESDALENMEDLCREVEPFEVSLGEVETFIPVTPTVFIRVAHAAYRMRELHDRLNISGLACREEWPYMPHLTIVKMSAEDQAQFAYRVARTRWAEFHQSRCVEVHDLTFVREEAQNRWADLAEIPLGQRLVPASGPAR
jgi:2'-5' RNA ligase